MSMPVIVPGTATRSQAITDLIESVALQEAGLAHIINAEGEKIQAVLAMQGVTTSDLLMVNRSVQCLIETATSLEMVLKNKLSLFQDELKA